MIASYVHWINGVAVVGIAGMVALGHDNMSGGSRSENIVEASISATNANRFMVVDHAASRTCIVAVHRAAGYDIHRIEPGNCEDMPAGLETARTWQNTPAGEVRISDQTGKPLMTLSVSDGFAWEVTKPHNVDVSFEAY